MSHLPTTSIGRLLCPRSVAIVGASPTPGALGASVLDNLIRAGYSGDIHLVNPKRAEINGRACVKSVDDLPEGIDCAVLAIPHAAVLPTIEACARRKVGSAIIFSAGFAEGGAEGLAEQTEIARVARQSGMVIEGPNCLGTINYIDATPLSFVKPPLTPLAGRKGIAIVSQSGAMAVVVGVGLNSRDLGLSFSISTGNEAASGVEDYIDYLLDDPNTAVITMLAEQFRNPRRFLDLARRARAVGKPIILLHPGRSAAAQASAATHTGAMAGDYAVMSMKVADAGVIHVASIEELLDVSELALRCSYMPRDGVAIVTESGAFKALALDFCEQLGLSVPAMSEASHSAIRAVLPDFIPVTNPFDLTAQALVDTSLYSHTLTVMAEDDSFGTVVLGLILEGEAISHHKFPPNIDAIRKSPPKKTVIFAALDEGAKVPQVYIDELRSLGVPFFPSPERAFRALARLTEFAKRKIVLDAPTVPTLPMLNLGTGVIPEYTSKLALSALGINIPKGRFARTLDEAQTVAAEIGFPVVLKAQSPDLSHKSDAGGVVLNLRDPAGVAEGWARLYSNVKAARPDLVLDGVLVETMGKMGTELIVGAKNDADWGPVLLVGFGGVMAELFHDARLIAPDSSRDAIIDELMKLKSSALFRGFRGAPTLDIAAAAEIIHRVGQFVGSDPRIKEIDINPVVVYPQGEGAIALDALILME